MTVDPTVTRRIGKYEITGTLGRGGMGVVYRAEDKRIGRPVAIKTLTEGFSGQPEMLERFYREAQAGILQHPNIVIVYDLGDENGIPFIVMELVTGEPLDKLIASGRQLPLIDKVGIIEQVCSALGYAHQRGIVHRDIKPANVIVQPDGHAKIVDFGIARIQRAAAETELTRTGSVIGTMHYIAPERLRGQAFDGRSDIFSTGVMLYQLLTGQLPFAGEDATVLHKLIHEQHPPLRAFVSGYPPALDAILDRALAKDPDQRYATAEEFAADLHAVGEDLKTSRVAELFAEAQALAAGQQFGRAREILLQLVRIDAQHTGAKQLLSVVQQHFSGQEQDRRRKLLEQIESEIENCLRSENYDRATEMVNRAVEQLPTEGSLLELKARVATQARAFRMRQTIDATVAKAEEAAQQSPVEALLFVQSALEEIPGEARLLALEDSLRQRLKASEKDEIRARYLREAQAAIDRSDFQRAIEILETYRQKYPDATGVAALLDFAKGELARQQRVSRLIDPASRTSAGVTAAAQPSPVAPSAPENTPAPTVVNAAVTPAAPRRSSVALARFAIVLLLAAAAAAGAWWFHRRIAMANQHPQPAVSVAPASAAQPAAPPPAAPVQTDASLVIHSTPGAQIGIDNTPQGQADAQGNLTVQVKPGTRTLQISLDGYQPTTQTVTVSPGDKTDIAAELKPVTAHASPAVPPPAVPVRILSFAATDAQIEPGQSTTLQWQTANASAVSIDNGIARVDPSGETTIRPQHTTTYLLTARGNGGVQQKSVDVIVQPKTEKPPQPTPQPTVQPLADPSPALLAAVTRFQAAYNAHDLAGLQAVWTGLRPQQVLGLQTFFKVNPAARVADQCPPSAIIVSGDVASWTCTETTTLLAGGKPLNHSQSIRFGFIHKNGSWTIQDRR